MASSGGFGPFSRRKPSVGPRSISWRFGARALQNADPSWALIRIMNLGLQGRP